MWKKGRMDLLHKELGYGSFFPRNLMKIRDLHFKAKDARSGSLQKFVYMLREITDALKQTHRCQVKIP